MHLNRLSIHNVRKIASADLTLNPSINLFVGPNGSGKTTLLESIYLLSGGRSFRTTRASDVISRGQNTLTVAGDIETQSKSVAIGVEKTSTATRLRLNSENVAAASTTVRLLPMLVLNSESFSLLEGGPSNRRDLLDRVLFHVEHGYFDVLRRFYQTLKQRNAAIRQEAGQKEIDLWNSPLIDTVKHIDNYRRSQVEILNGALHSTGIQDDLGLVELAYEPGWRKEIDFENALELARDRDRTLKTTTVGPHRAEVKVLVEGQLAKKSASRGQTKLLIVALIAAMQQVIKQGATTEPVLLIDDLASELDVIAKTKAIQLLTKAKTQAFFTAIEYNSLISLRDFPSHLFHVEHGQITLDT